MLRGGTAIRAVLMTLACSGGIFLPAFLVSVVIEQLLHGANFTGPLATQLGGLAFAYLALIEGVLLGAVAQGIITGVLAESMDSKVGRPVVFALALVAIPLSEAIHGGTPILFDAKGSLLIALVAHASACRYFVTFRTQVGG